jgi:hypothetical protein
MRLVINLKTAEALGFAVLVALICFRECFESMLRLPAKSRAP